MTLEQIEGGQGSIGRYSKREGVQDSFMIPLALKPERTCLRLALDIESSNLING